MNILVTGSKGFIGKNLIAYLNNILNGNIKSSALSNHFNVLEFDNNNNDEDLYNYCLKADVIVHLAGVNRPKHESEFLEGNVGLTQKIVNILFENNLKTNIIITSSIQAELNNAYGTSKKQAEEVLLNYANISGAKVYIYRLANAFGKWCKPNYNSVIATFCHNIANDLPININNTDTILKLVYIDDIVNELINAIAGKANQVNGIYTVKPVYTEKLGDIAKYIQSFKNIRQNLKLPAVSNGFINKLYSTYLSYLPQSSFKYELKGNFDNRGSFTEFIRTEICGQFSVNVSKPNIVKGNHWHNSKNEKFLVVSGKAIIRFRKILEKDIIEYHVSGDKLEVVDIPTGYTHNIQNVGQTDLVTLMWCNECFDANNPDTYFEEV